MNRVGLQKHKSTIKERAKNRGHILKKHLWEKKTKKDTQEAVREKGVQWSLWQEMKISRRNTWATVINSSQKSERMKTGLKTIKFSHLKFPGTATSLCIILSQWKLYTSTMHYFVIWKRSFSIIVDIRTMENYTAMKKNHFYKEQHKWISQPWFNERNLVRRVQTGRFHVYKAQEGAKLIHGNEGWESSYLWGSIITGRKHQGAY